MKVVFIGMGAFTEQKGGLNRYLSDMISSLENNLEAYLHCFMSNNTDKSDPNNLVLSKNVIKRFFYSRIKLGEEIRKLSPCIVNIHFALTAFPLMGLLTNYKIIMNFQGPWYKEGKLENYSLSGQLRSYAKKNIEKYVYKRVDHFIVLSKSFAVELEEAFNIPKEKITIIPPIVDIDKFNYSERKLEAKADGCIQFVTVRRLVKRTGVDLLLRAFALCMENVPEFKFHLKIVGQGWYEGELQKLACDLGISDQVTFCGFVDDEDLPEIYQNADFSVMPTIALEGFGLSTIESLSCGTPVIGTPSSANIEVIGKFNANLLADAVDEKALSEKLLECPRLNISKDDCRQHVLDHYSKDSYVMKITNLFNEVKSEV